MFLHEKGTQLLKDNAVLEATIVDVMKERHEAITTLDVCIRRLKLVYPHEGIMINDLTCVRNRMAVR